MNYKSIAEYEEAKKQKAVSQQKQQQQEIDSDPLKSLQQEAKRLEALHVQLCDEYGDSGAVRQQFEEILQKIKKLKEHQRLQN